MHIFGVVHQSEWFLWFSFYTCLAIKRSRCELVCFCLICYWIKFERRQSDRYSPLAVNYATDIHHIFNIEATVGKTACCGVGRVYIVNYLERKKLALGCIQAAMSIGHMGTWTWAGAWAHELSKLVKRLANTFGATTWENMEHWWCYFYIFDVYQGEQCVYSILSDIAWLAITTMSITQHLLHIVTDCNSQTNPLCSFLCFLMRFTVSNAC